MKKIILHTAALNSEGVRCEAGTEFSVGTGKSADISPADAKQLVDAGLASEVTVPGGSQSPADDVEAAD